MNKNALQLMKLLLNNNVLAQMKGNAPPLMSNNVLLSKNKNVQRHTKQYALEEALVEDMAEVLVEDMAEVLMEEVAINGNHPAKDVQTDGREAHSSGRREEAVEDVAIPRNLMVDLMDHLEDILLEDMEDIKRKVEVDNNASRYHKNRAAVYPSKNAKRYQSNPVITCLGKNALQ